MSLIKCPECGKDNVSDSAVSCPGCGYNIQVHIIKKQEQEENEKRLQQLQIKKQLAVERKNDPMYKKRKIQMICAIVLVVVLLVFVIIFAQKYKTMKAYEKDLSSVFGIDLNVTVEDIIEYEAVNYGHTEYNYGETHDGDLRLEFAPVQTSTRLSYRHCYFFSKDTGLLETILYRDIIDGKECKHIDTIKEEVLSVSSNWDKRDSLFFYMYGNIDNTKCSIRYESEAGRCMWLWIDREE